MSLLIVDGFSWLFNHSHFAELPAILVTKSQNVAWFKAIITISGWSSPMKSPVTSPALADSSTGRGRWRAGSVGGSSSMAEDGWGSKDQGSHEDA